MSGCAEDSGSQAVALENQEAWQGFETLTGSLAASGITEQSNHNPRGMAGMCVLNAGENTATNTKESLFNSWDFALKAKLTNSTNGQIKYFFFKKYQIYCIHYIEILY